MVRRRACFIAISVQRCWALGLVRRGGFGADGPGGHGPASWRLRATPRNNSASGQAAGKRDADPCRRLGDASCDLEQAQPQGGELGGGERLRLGDGVAHRQHEPVGGGVQHEADLVGERGSAAGAVRRELALMELDQVFRLSARAVERIVEPFGAADASRLVTTQRMSRPMVLASILAETRRWQPQDLAP